jgi:hypothetical protein
VSWIARRGGLLKRDRLDRELDEARYDAQRRFGNTTLINACFLK